MEKVEKTEVKEMPQAEQKMQKQVPFKLKESSRLEIDSQELGFLINLGASLMPYLQLSQAIQQSVAFSEYLKEKLVKSEQVEFISDEATKPLVEPLKQEDSEEDKAASEELSKMRVVHKSETQEELANQ